MKRLIDEFRHFLSHPYNMRVLLMTNLLYGMAMPVMEIFIGAYVMRNTNDTKLVAIYQLAYFSAIPITFYINGLLMSRFPTKFLYAFGMLLSGVGMFGIMLIGHLSMAKVIGCGLLMGFAGALFWANRDYLTLKSTHDQNRNYYFSLESVFFMVNSICIPFIVGWFIAGTEIRGYLGGDRTLAYQIVAVAVTIVTLFSSYAILRGKFEKAEKFKVLYSQFNPLWWRLMLLAIFNGLTQGFMVIAPTMLILRLVGQEGAIATIQTVCCIFSAFVLYLIGRLTNEKHRFLIYTISIILFTLGTLVNAALFNAIGVMVFMACMALSRPFQSIAYSTIALRVVDIVSAIEKRHEYAYFMHQEFFYFFGRLIGLVLFLLLSYQISEVFALRYCLAIIGLILLAGTLIAKNLITECDRHR